MPVTVQFMKMKAAVAVASDGELRRPQCSRLNLPIKEDYLDSIRKS